MDVGTQLPSSGSSHSSPSVDPAPYSPVASPPSTESDHPTQKTTASESDPMLRVLTKSDLSTLVRLTGKFGLFHLIGIHPLLMTFVPWEEVVALGCPRGLKCWLSQGGSQAFWPVRGSKSLFSGYPRGAQKPRLSGLSQGGQNAMSKGVGCRWQIVPWGSKLSQYVPRGLTLFLRVVL